MKGQHDGRAQARRVWSALAPGLRSQVSTASWNTWFADVVPIDIAFDTLVLEVPSSLARERIEARFGGMVQDALTDLGGSVCRLQTVLADAPHPDGPLVPDGPRRPEERGEQGEHGDGMLAATHLAHRREDRTSDSTSADREPGRTGDERRTDGQAKGTRGSTPDPPGFPTLFSPPGDNNSGTNDRGTNDRGTNDRGNWQPPRAGATNVGKSSATSDRRDASANFVASAQPLLNPRYTFDDFVIGSSNRFAHAAAMSVAGTPARSYNPLFIYGDSGLGKTHLLQAIAHYVREYYPQSRVRYVTTETFMNEFIDAIRSNMGPAFKRSYRDDCDVLLVDDIQFMEGREGTQEEFFHTFNFLFQSGRQIVISSDRPPKSIATLEDRLRSRFESGLITDVQPPELETRVAILQRKAERERQHVPDEVLNFIATNVKYNIRELEGALNRVCAYAGLNKVELDLATAERVLADLLSGNEPRPITARVIIDATSDMFGFGIDELVGQSRRRPLVTARQIGMYVLRELTDYSYPMIGREFGNRDHTTVIHAVDKVGQQMRERRAIYDQVTELIRVIKSSSNSG